MRAKGEQSTRILASFSPSATSFGAVFVPMFSLPME